MIIGKLLQVLFSENYFSGRIYNAIQRFHYHRSLQQTGSIWDRGGIINLEITITKDITERQCWQMIIQFTCPVSVRGTWNDVKLVNKSSEFISNISIPEMTKQMKIFYEVFQI